jgi:hypothetical protein
MRPDFSADEIRGFRVSNAKDWKDGRNWEEKSVADANAGEGSQRATLEPDVDGGTLELAWRGARQRSGLDTQLSMRRDGSEAEERHCSQVRAD